MGPTTLAALHDAVHVTALADGLRLRVPPAWIVDGEDRVSSTTILRLIECCREYHWLRDVVTRHWGAGADCICRRLETDFVHTIAAGEEITITYAVQAIGRRSYTVRFVVADSDRTVCATSVMVLVFYDARTRSARAPSPHVVAGLAALAC